VLVFVAHGTFKRAICQEKLSFSTFGETSLSDVLCSQILSWQQWQEKITP